jgi:hypothetical protein
MDINIYNELKDDAEREAVKGAQTVDGIKSAQAPKLVTRQQLRYIYICIYICIKYTYTYAYIYIYMYIYIYICIYT